MTEQEYLWAWLAYICGALIFYAWVFYETRGTKWAEFKQIIRIIIAIGLAVPWYTDAQHGFLSPAWLTSVADALLKGPEAFWRAGLPLVLSLVIAIIVSCIYQLFRWYRQRSVNSSETQAS